MEDRWSIENRSTGAAVHLVLRDPGSRELRDLLVVDYDDPETVVQYVRSIASQAPDPDPATEPLTRALRPDLYPNETP